MITWEEASALVGVGYALGVGSIFVTDLLRRHSRPSGVVTPQFEQTINSPTVTAMLTEMARKHSEDIVEVLDEDGNVLRRVQAGSPNWKTAFDTPGQFLRDCKGRVDPGRQSA